jgi:(p)ppGpp synthase/HD superfamily hydrolase
MSLFDFLGIGKSFPHLTFDKKWSDFRAVAIKTHGKQMYGDLPYAIHLATVEYLLAENGFNEYHYQAGAWLHDIVEDTPVKVENIVSAYGETVGAIVWACTGEGANRKAKNASIYKKLEQFPLAAPVKVADRIANLMECGKSASEGDISKLQMYLKEWPTFRERIEPLMQDERRKQAFWHVLLEQITSMQETYIEKPKKDAEEEAKKGADPKARP